MVADAMGIAGSTSPVNTQRARVERQPATTIKYNLPEAIAHCAIAAVSLAELGHTGDRLILDDAEYGYAKFIRSGRWEPENIGEDFGSQWLFPAESSIDPYPHAG